jgi:hypothetical protein
MFRKLDPEQIVLTAMTLERRIAERFPRAGLAKVARELSQVTREARAHYGFLRKKSCNRPIAASHSAEI